MTQIFYPKYRNKLSFSNKASRLLWGVVWGLLFRPFTLSVFHKWRLFLLRLFGAKIGAGSIVHGSVKIWAPWNLEIGQRTAIGPSAECYNPGKIILGNKVTVSQRAYLCAASHDYNDKAHPLITKPIVVNDFAWVAADAFVAMGVTVGEGAIVGARAVVSRDVEPWAIVAGNPAVFVKRREMKEV